MTKVYISSRITRRAEMAEVAQKLEAVGFTITSSWVRDASEQEYKPKTDYTEAARLDHEQVIEADILLTFSEPLGSANVGGGRHTELGIALGLGRRCAVVGPKEQVFHWHPKVMHYDTLDDFIQIWRPYGRGSTTT